MPMRLSFRLVAVILLLSGCQHLQKPETQAHYEFAADWAERQVQLAQIQHWQATGKLGIKTEHDGGSANLHWLQANGNYQIDLVGPLGQGKVSISNAQGLVTLIEAGQNPVTAKSAEELLLKATGWRVPVAELSYWLRALPDPSHPIESLAANPQGRLGEMKQLGWQVSYLDYLPATLDTSVSQPMPSRIIAQFKSPSGELKLTLIVREWKLGGAP